MPPDPTSFRSTLGMTGGNSSGLLTFLKQARGLTLSTTQYQCMFFNATSTAPIYVLGNQSADLDSIVSAILVSYLFSRAKGNDGRLPRLYVPLINLPDVPAGRELRRLRPEFATAFSLATSASSSPSRSNITEADQDGSAISQLLKEHVLTVADLRAHILSQRQKQEKKENNIILDAALVDWNALPVKSADKKKGQGSVDGLADLVSLNVKGCIDHHGDESFVAADADPRVIEVGPGSCTSLVVREARRRGLWASSCSPPTDDCADDDVEAIAKLALAAILIDTTNLTAEGKVTDVDREAVSFLEARIGLSCRQEVRWDRDSFFTEIQHAKQHSLDWLTVSEILGRDFKDWKTASNSAGTASPKKATTIGICSVVRPLQWIVEKARQEEDAPSTEGMKQFLSKLCRFAEDRGLGVVCVMTAFTAPADGSFQRELLVWALDDEIAIKTVEGFVNAAQQELGLERRDHEHDNTIDHGRLYIWHQKNVAKSRKQVAPLLRSVFTD